MRTTMPENTPAHPVTETYTASVTTAGSRLTLDEAVNGIAEAFDHLAVDEIDERYDVAWEPGPEDGYVVTATRAPR